MVWTMPSTISGLVISDAQTIQKKGENRPQDDKDTGRDHINFEPGGSAQRGPARSPATQTVEGPDR